MGEGRQEEIVAIRSDFRPVAGVMLAHRTVEIALPSREAKSRLVWTDIRANVDIPDEWFSPPLAEYETRFQEFRHTALEGDAGSLMSDYQTFLSAADHFIHRRRENALNTLAYELMSHERWDRSIAVLRLAVDLYPESANLYDSLGEAYMLSGDAENSIANYERSIQLDPENEHARTMVATQQAERRAGGE